MRALVVALVAVVPVQLAPASAASVTAAELLSQLTTEAEVRTGYQRDLFPHWVDDDGDGCDTRREVLIAESLTPVQVGSGCSLSGGTWYSAFDGATWTDSADVDIDHMVPLAEAWDSGARSWSAQTRRAFANDLGDADTLIAVTDSVNQAKGDKDPASWMPPLSSYSCDYAIAWVRVKYRWSLTVDTAERSALSSTLSGECGSRSVTTPTRAGVTTGGPTTFSDVPSNHVWFTQITWLAGQGVTTGYADGTFRPGAPVLREQMAAFLYRLAGSPDVANLPAVSPFVDVPTSHAFYRQIVWLSRARITTGYADGTFRPGQPVLREQMAAFLHRLENSPAPAYPSSSPFVDVNGGHTFYGSIVWLAGQGISTGWDVGYGCREYRPGLAVQRGDMAAFMYRLRNGGTPPVVDGSGCRPPAPPQPPVTPTGPVAPVDAYNCPAHAPIKGNANSGIYHVPGGQYYAATKPEQCFRTEADAVAAGYRRSQR
ncbi:hypothetical protein GCM10009710_00580 [Aeromicrobium alkaliterrae]|uniref:SLH domain-containing protein n=1 Tax=Aeromicrobium alkaliterrae TaxID=302168 RepID=A0ABN2JF20_9ACTN